MFNQTFFESLTVKHSRGTYYTLNISNVFQVSKPVYKV
jgi:hypothetical protein